MTKDTEIIQQMVLLLEEMAEEWADYLRPDIDRFGTHYGSPAPFKCSIYELRDDSLD